MTVPAIIEAAIAADAGSSHIAAIPGQTSSAGKIGSFRNDSARSSAAPANSVGSTAATPRGTFPPSQSGVAGQPPSWSDEFAQQTNLLTAGREPWNLAVPPEAGTPEAVSSEAQPLTLTPSSASFATTTAGRQSLLRSIPEDPGQRLDSPPGDRLTRRGTLSNPVSGSATPAQTPPADNLHSDPHAARPSAGSSSASPDSSRPRTRSSHSGESSVTLLAQINPAASVPVINQLPSTAVLGASGTSNFLRSQSVVSAAEAGKAAAQPLAEPRSGGGSATSAFQRGVESGSAASLSTTWNRTSEADSSIAGTNAGKNGKDASVPSPRQGHPDASASPSVSSDLQTTKQPSGTEASTAAGSFRASSVREMQVRQNESPQQTQALAPTAASTHPANLTGRFDLNAAANPAGNLASQFQRAEAPTQAVAGFPPGPSSTPSSQGGSAYRPVSKPDSPLPSASLAHSSGAGPAAAAIEEIRAQNKFKISTVPGRSAEIGFTPTVPGHDAATTPAASFPHSGLSETVAAIPGASPAVIGPDSGPGSGPDSGKISSNPFETMDNPTRAVSEAFNSGPSTSAAAHQLRVGYEDPILGYVELSAHTGSSGVHASLEAQSAAAGEMLSGHLGALAGWMDERHTPAESLTVSTLASPPDSTHPGMDSTAHGNGAGAHAGNNGAGDRGNEVQGGVSVGAAAAGPSLPVAPAQAAHAAQASFTSPALSGGSSFSVVA